MKSDTFRGATGIYKTPVPGPVRVGPLGLEGDAVCNTRHHGGPDQAVYGYRAEDYRHFEERVGHALAPGTFGENLTLHGVPDTALPIGTRLQFEDLELEVTAPRIPCNTLAGRMNDPEFVRTFLREERPGFYCRVLRAGTVAAGSPFVLSLPEGAGEAARDTVALFRDVRRTLTAAELNAWLAMPIDARTRDDFEQRLARSS